MHTYNLIDSIVIENKLRIKRINRLRMYPFYIRNIGDVSDNTIENLYDDKTE